MAIRPATIANIRFGYGFSPRFPPAQGPDDLIADLVELRPAQVPDLKDVTKLVLDRRDAARDARQAKPASGKEPPPLLKKAFDDANTRLREGRIAMASHRILTPLRAPVGYQERLLSFWSDHFTVIAKGFILGVYAPHLIESVIRPNLTARFEDMLISVVRHPAMLVYLDQINSIGPNSRVGRKRRRGLNENLAREIFELHTLGVDGPYSQDDVREFAELLTGYSFDYATASFTYRKRIAEPGRETVLGRSYGGEPPLPDHAETLLRDLARHPATARHLATKIATHFISDEPDAALVSELEAVWLKTDGDLRAVSEALVTHPLAWEAPLSKARQPYDFLIATLRALNADPGALLRQPKEVRRLMADLGRMGQPLLQPPGPDGWPEDEAAWITPQGIAGRITFAVRAARSFAGETDPRQFLARTLAGRISDELKFSVSSAAAKHEGIALTLLSPEFNRR